MSAANRTSVVRFAVALCLVLLTALMTAASAAATAQRAIVDVNIQDETATQQEAHVGELADQLRARYVRLTVEWNRAEPAKGVYDEEFLARTEHVLDLAAAKRLRVVITVAWTPEWASDQSLWGDPPDSRYPKGVYQPFYAPRAGAVDDFGAFAAMLAERYADNGVFAYECWNEPNLWTFFYPQIHDGNTEFAAERYTKLLAAFSAAVKDKDPDALVIGGATAPVGRDDKNRTSPATFATYLKRQGAFAYMDAYSHHPYQPGPDPKAPEAAPTSPDFTVTLQNLGTLLKIVPDHLDFYLTEYGYNTATSNMFGVTGGLTQAQQADYLRRAYRYAGRYSRVKALFWYLRQDSSPSGKASDANGVYTGLRTISSSRKRSWFVFAGGMKLTLAARSPIQDGAYTKLSGVLTCSRLATATSSGGLSGKTLQVQRLASGAWKTVKTVKTRSGGRFTAWVRLSRSSRLRVRWEGVVASATRYVAAR
jgi:hypothetical protein